MSVFASHAPARTRPFVVFAVTLVLFAVGMGIVLGLGGRGIRTASQLHALGTATPEPTGTTFPEPVPVDWDGHITRMLAGGQGIEVKSTLVEGGYFFAYLDQGFPASVSAAPLAIHGRWLGTSCEYGRCAPEVQVESWQPLSIELE